MLQRLQDALQTLLRHTALLLADVLLHCSQRQESASASGTSQQDDETELQQAQRFAARASELTEELQGLEVEFSDLGGRLQQLPDWEDVANGAGQQAKSMPEGAGELGIALLVLNLGNSKAPPLTTPKMYCIQQENELFFQMPCSCHE